jgi:SagB-type dehydrogenase family enzyme
MGTPQRNGAPAPPLQRPYTGSAPLTQLIPAADISVGRMPLFEAIMLRRSRREYTSERLTLEEFSFLLWAAQGVHGTTREGTATSRTVPSGGARHPFETYLYIRRVEGLDRGLYRYLALEHALCFLDGDPELEEKVHTACFQKFVQNAAAVFIWTAVPYRMEWRYSFLAHKVIAQETGHLCQNLYLACESIGAGACALGTYDQDALDAILRVDGNEEFAIYVGVVGKVVPTP